jgi:putative transposase
MTTNDLIHQVPRHRNSRFPPGTLLRAAGVVCRVGDDSNDRTVFLQDIGSGEVRCCEPAFLEMALDQGTAVVVEASVLQAAALKPVHLRDDEQRILDSIPLALRGAAAVKVMLKKSRWINRLKAHGVKQFRPSPDLAMAVRDVEHQTKETCPYGMDTLYDAARKLRRYGDDPRVVLPHFHLRGGPGKSRLEPEVETVIHNALIAAAKPEAGRLQASRVHEAVTAQIIQINRTRPDDELCFPSVPTITRRFSEHFTAYEVCVRNYGKKRADRLYRQAGVRIRAERPLDVVQYDDTDTAVFLVDDRTGLPWGRCWLTPGVDEYTSAVLGISMSERHRSSESAIEAVISGIFAKDHTRPEYALCKGKWEWYGHHGIVVLDNASYNTGVEAEASIIEFGCEVQFARPHHPQDKSDIEHFNARLAAEFIANQPGWAGPKEDRELLDRGLGSAVMTLDQFTQRLTSWIVDDYSNKPCGKLGKTPREAWNEAFALLPPMLPRRMPTQELMGTILRPLSFRDSGGLLRMGLRYQSGELEVLQKRLGRRATVTTRYSPRTLEYLYVLDPLTRNYLKVPCIEDPRYIAGLTNYQQSLIRKKAAKMKYRSPSLEQMYEARQALVVDTVQLAKSKKLRDRKNAFLLRSAGIGGDNKPGGTDASNGRTDGSAGETVVMTELEAMVLELDQVQLDDDMEMEVVNLGAAT